MPGVAAHFRRSVPAECVTESVLNYSLVSFIWFDIVVFSAPLVKDLCSGHPLTAWFCKRRHILSAFFLLSGHIKAVISESWELRFQYLLISTSSKLSMVEVELVLLNNSYSLL